jgi:hypothetical protein
MSIRVPALIAAPALAAVLVAGPPEADAGTKRAKTVRLKAFASCAGLVDYARRHVSAPRPGVPAPRPGVPVPVGGGPVSGGGEEGGAAPGPVSAPSPGAREDSSTTNVQEVGIDEPDVVKTDGTRIYALASGRLHAIDARAATPKLLGTLTTAGSGREFLVRGDRALVFGHTGTGTVLSEVDLSNPASMRVLRTLTVDGAFVSARLHAGTARVVLTSIPRAVREIPRPGPGPVPVADAARRRPLRARTAGWVPSATLRNRRTGRVRRRAVVACDDVRRTTRFTGVEMLTVLTIDLDRGLPAIESDAVMTSAETVYASTGSLYVATNGFSGDTAIHRFDISSPSRTEYRASGQVPGSLLNQFSLSEHRGVLRAASTSGFAGPSSSYVTVLRDRGGTLEKIGQVGDLGRGERIFAVRFIEDRGYVVTFRQTDPLYTVDLSDPAGPAVRGELKIPGYSAYLHPVGDHLLLGIGQDATEEGRTLGTQLSLFDVADAAAPTRLHKHTIPGGSSDVEFDHHALLWWAPANLAVVPVSGRAVGFRVSRESGIAEAGRLAHEGDHVSRSLVIGDRLFTYSSSGLLAARLDTLAPGPWVPFGTG